MDNKNIIMNNKNIIIGNLMPLTELNALKRDVSRVLGWNLKEGKIWQRRTEGGKLVEVGKRPEFHSSEQKVANG